MTPMLHRYDTPIDGISLPERFNNPFDYEPHPLCVRAAEAVRRYVDSRAEWHDEVAAGKMFGVLVVRDTAGGIGFLAAFSGNLAGTNRHAYFVPPVYDMLRPGAFFRRGEAEISALNARIDALERSAEYREAQRQAEALRTEAEARIAEAADARRAARAAREARRRAGVTDAEAAAMIRESQHEKAELRRLRQGYDRRIAEAQQALAACTAAIDRLKSERRERSAALQRRLFGEFRLLNARGEARDLCTLFAEAGRGEPPAGAGECAAPKLLQYAYLHGLKPIAMAEFWRGASPRTEIRRDGCYYPACRGKCAPILAHMLRGLATEPQRPREREIGAVKILYEDEWMAAVDKPAGVLSVPGRSTADSLLAWAQRRFSPEALPVHRLDMETSGVLLIAKTRLAYQRLQAQFRRRTVRKSYVALLDGIAASESGRIELPLCPDPDDRPRQQVHPLGKPAVTDYRVIAREADCTRILFRPLTGRTHQLRVHAAHPAGLNLPIVGDALYGRREGRLRLHAAEIVVRHPATGEELAISSPVPF